VLTAPPGRGCGWERPAPDAGRRLGDRSWSPRRLWGLGWSGGRATVPPSAAGRRPAAALTATRSFPPPGSARDEL